MERRAQMDALNEVYVEVFDEVYSVSDLHLGGASGFQMFKQGQLLGDFIDSLCTLPPDRRVALVLNGDIVDFLADPTLKEQYFDNQNAVSRLATIFEDDEFKPVWDALARFVRERKYGRLVFVIGNHDLELALPYVRTALLQQLAGTEAAVRARIAFAMDGVGYTCEVGKRRAYFVHGNEFDCWNVVDHESLRQRVQAQLRGHTDPSDWIPNFGTRFVIDVMNHLKQKHPFIDLLKPAWVAGAVLPLIDAKTWKELPALIDNFAMFVFRQPGRMLRESELLSGVDQQAEAKGDALNDVNGYAEMLLGAMAVGGDYQDYMGADGDSYLLWCERAIRQLPQDMNDPAMLSFISPFVSPYEETLGWRESVAGWLTNVGQRVTSWWSSWRKSEKKRVSRWMNQVGSEIDFLIIGHTHAAKAISIDQGARWFFNSGTWARLIELDLDDRELLTQQIEDLKGKSIDELDRSPLVVSRPTVVRIWRKDDDVVDAGLFEVQYSADGGETAKIKLAPQKVSEYALGDLS